MSAIAQPVSSAKTRPSRMPSGWHELRTLIPYVLRYKRFVALGLFTLAVMGIAGALPQLIIGAVMDCLRGSAVPLSTLSGTARHLLHPLFGFYSPRSSHALGLYCLILVAVMVVKGFFSYWTRWVLIGMSRDIEFDLRNDVLARLLELDPEFYARNRTGDLMSRATNDLNAVRMVLGPGIMYTAVTLATMVLAIFFMVKLSPELTLWVLIPVPFVALAVRYFGQIIHRLSEQIQAALGALSTRAQENLTGIRVVRAYAQEQAEIKVFDEANREYIAQNIKLIGSWSLFMPALSVLIGSTVVLLVALGGRQAIDGRLSLGTFSSFYMFLIQLIFPMIAIGYVTNIFQRGAASMGRLNYILNARPNLQEQPVPAHTSVASAASNGQSLAQDGTQSIATAGAISGEIDFRHLSFAYPAGSNGTGGIEVLRDINLHVPAGATLAIVGPTGSGKSTLASLIGRLWEAPRGTVLIDGRSVDEYPLADLRHAIGYVTNIFQRGAASMGRLNYILNARQNLQEQPVPAHTSVASAASNGQSVAQDRTQSIAAAGAISGEIDFRHLSFAYPAGSNGSGGIEVLRDITLHVPAGATLAIVGPTGSGKSTLASLIGRLWEAPRGTVLIDGRSVDEYPLADLRHAISYVPQDTFLFSDTIRGNIAFGVSEAAEEQVLEAAEIAGISGEILAFPHGFDTMVGERGITLSGGQKQRTSIARAILRQPRILILDDALSSVDTETEERILRQLRGVMSRRTTILISHRISTVCMADQIAVMREGRIVERGTHDELLALGGYYADLYQKQLLEEELERE